MLNVTTYSRSINRVYESLQRTLDQSAICISLFGHGWINTSEYYTHFVGIRHRGDNTLQSNCIIQIVISFKYLFIQLISLNATYITVWTTRIQSITIPISTRKVNQRLGFTNYRRSKVNRFPIFNIAV